MTPSDALQGGYRCPDGVECVVDLFGDRMMKRKKVHGWRRNTDQDAFDLQIHKNPVLPCADLV